MRKSNFLKGKVLEMQRRTRRVRRKSLSRMKQKYIQLTVKKEMKKKPRLIRKVTKKWL